VLYCIYVTASSEFLNLAPIDIKILVYFILQLSQLPLHCKRPSYYSLEGANVTPTSFYNIGDLEIQDNLARVWYVSFLSYIC
jgi:hypothetical protein